MLLRIGRAADLHRDFGAMFIESNELQELAQEYLAVVVEISTQIVHYAQKSTLGQITSSVLSTFNSTFAPLESKLQTIDSQIVRHADSLAVQRNHKEHTTTQSMVHRVYSKVSMELAISNSARAAIAMETSKHQFLASLCADQGEFTRIYRKYRRKGDSSWLFETTDYRDWANADRSSFLYLRGALGSGKSVVMASAVASLIVASGKDGSSLVLAGNDASSARTICSFFCTALNPRTLEPSSIFGSIAYQVLSSASMAPFLAKFLNQRGSTDIGSTDPETCVDILLEITPPAWHCYIVLDGLDQCSPRDLQLIFGEMSRLSSQRNIHLLCSSSTLR